MEVSGGILLPNLHSLILAVMGWSGGHLHAFQAGGIAYGEPDSDFDDGMENEHRVCLSQIAFAEKCKFKYEYDFGDGWIHTVLVEKILPAEPGKAYPVCTAGKRACPPEDCGGPWGYSQFLEAISNAEHEEHKELLRWIGGDFDPEDFDVEVVNKQLGARI